MSLTAMCPISLRSENDRTPGNQVGAMFVPLHTNIGDAPARLHAVHASTGAAKELQNAVDARALTDLSKFIPEATAAQAGRMAATQAIANENVAPRTTRWSPTCPVLRCRCTWLAPAWWRPTGSAWCTTTWA